LPVGIKISLKWENLERLIRYLDNFPNELSRQVETQLHEAMTQVRDEAKRNCPVDTGSLQRSIRIQTYAKQAGVMHKIGVSAGGYIINPKTGRRVDYASHVEYGTARVPAQPFLRPAFENKKRDLRRLILQAIKTVLISY